VPTRSGPVATVERLLSYPEAHEVGRGGRKPTCTCGACRRAEIAATRAAEIVPKGGRSAKPVSPAARLASRRVRVASRA
jgi:hypothetical protein